MVAGNPAFGHVTAPINLFENLTQTLGQTVEGEILIHFNLDLENFTHKH